MTRQIQSLKADKDLERIRESIQELVALGIKDGSINVSLMPALLTPAIEETLEWIALDQAPHAIYNFENSLKVLRIKVERILAHARQMTLDLDQPFNDFNVYAPETH